MILWKIIIKLIIKVWTICIKKKKNQKKEIIPKKDENNKYFEELIESSEFERNKEKRKFELLKIILEKSQYLTKEELQDMAKIKHISCVCDESLVIIKIDVFFSKFVFFWTIATINII